VVNTKTPNSIPNENLVIYKKIYTSANIKDIKKEKSLIFFASPRKNHKKTGYLAYFYSLSHRLAALQTTIPNNYPYGKEQECFKTRE